MAIKAQAPIVPVALHGTAEAMPRGGSGQARSRQGRGGRADSHRRADQSRSGPADGDGAGAAADDADRVTRPAAGRQAAQTTRQALSGSRSCRRRDRTGPEPGRRRGTRATDGSGPRSAGGTWAGHEVVGADHVVAQLGELGAVAIVGAGRQPVLLDPRHPAKLELVAPLAVGARVGGGPRPRRFDIEVPFL